MKTLVDKYACVYFGKLPWKIGNHVRNRSWRYALLFDLQMHCFFASIYRKWFPWEYTDGHTRSGRGNVHVWLTRYVPLPFFFVPSTSKLCLVEVYEIFKFKKIIQFHNLVSLNWVAILLQFALNRVRIEGFQQHSPNQTSFNSSPSPTPGEVSSLIHNDNSAKTAWSVFFRVKNEKKLYPR